MSRKAILGFLAAFVFIILLVLGSRPIAEKIVGLFYKDIETLNPSYSFALAESNTGIAFLKHAGRTETQVIKDKKDLVHLDQLKTEKNSTLNLKFKNGWALQLSSKTSAVLESYKPDSENAPILVTIVYGDYVVLTQGPAGLLYISKENKIFAPQAAPNVVERKIVIAPAIVKSEPVTPPETPSELQTGGPAPEPVASAKMPGKMPEKFKNGDEETLSSAYIESVLNSQSADLRKCQLNSLRDNKTSEGSILLSVTIAPSGKAQDVKLLQNVTQNTQLGECAKSIIERTKFKSFAGLPITLTYPLEFK